jgi:hypothetical protein
LLYTAQADLEGHQPGAISVLLATLESRLTERNIHRDKSQDTEQNRFQRALLNCRIMAKAKSTADL